MKKAINNAQEGVARTIRATYHKTSLANMIIQVGGAASAIMEIIEHENSD